MALGVACVADASRDDECVARAESPTSSPDGEVRAIRGSTRQKANGRRSVCAAGTVLCLFVIGVLASCCRTADGNLQADAARGADTPGQNSGVRSKPISIEHHFKREQDESDGHGSDQETATGERADGDGEGWGGARDEGDVVCAPLHVSGVEHCEEWKEKNVTSGLLSAKQEMLKRIVRVLEDPKSAGIGGDPSKPLLLVQELAVDEVDAVTGAATPVYLGKATDAGGWNPQFGGMNRWLARYYRDVLDSTRPVLVEVHGDDTCALEVEISSAARAVAPASAGAPEAADESPSWENEDFDVPLALMTVGWDPSGDPTHTWSSSGRDVNCALRMLNLPRVVVWLTSHKQEGSHDHPKFHYMPIGFGGWDTRNGLPQSAYLDDAKRQLKTMETCDFNMIGRYDLLFACFTLERPPRETMWREMTENAGRPAPVNHCPLPPDEMVDASTKGIFAISPPGTGVDCFRHYEMMVGGNIALVPDEDSLRSFMGGLPAFFMGKDVPWAGLTCDRLLEMAYKVMDGVRDGGGDAAGWGLQYEKLTHGYWRKFIREKMLEGAGLAPDTPYVERSAEPLNPPEWDTHRLVGCYKREEGGGDALRWEEGENSESDSCASFCSSGGHDGAGTGFFGITSDSKCWCGNDIGSVVSDGVCESPVPCPADDTAHADGCVAAGDQLSDVYVFGPADEPLEFVYHGCFAEHSRFLYHAQHRFRHAMTPTLCGAFCNSLRYPYFGVERSDWCRCGVMSAYAVSSIREPAWADDTGPHIELGAPDFRVAGLPLPGALIGDPRFQCGDACGGDEEMQGCGGVRAWDMYSVTTPCVLFRDCDVAERSGHRP